MADFNLPHLYLAPLSAVTPSEFCRDLWHQKTRVPGLLCGIVCVILHLAVLVQYWRVTDRRTDRRTQDDSIYRASIESHGKNGSHDYVPFRVFGVVMGHSKSVEIALFN